jgi:endonuclease YncB( thermonuclease family)
MKLMPYTFLLLIWLCSIAYAEQKAVIASVSDNHIITLEDSTNLELAGIIIPPEYKKNASEIISKSIGQGVLLVFGEQKKNRHGNYTAQVKTESGQWLQQLILEAGLAYIYPNNDTMLKEMQNAEQQARSNKIGLWQNQSILTTNEAIEKVAEYKGKFTIVEGEIFAIKKAKDKTYINFDTDWKTDFSIGISKENTKDFGKITDLVGKKIRVRGWLESYNGPFIEVYQPEQLEIL